MVLKVDYVARETFINLRRNLLMTSAAVLTVAISLSLVGGAFLLRQGVSNATIQWKGGVELSVFVKPDATTQQIESIQAQLQAMPTVKKITFVSKEDAYEEFKKLFASNPDLVETVNADVLPPSFRVVPKAVEQIEEIGDPFRERPGVHKVVYADQIDSLISFSNLLQAAFFGVALLLLVSASVLIVNTIRMAIYSRRREVAVMKLVGATNWFIRVPFMFEGLLQGVAGAVVAFGVVAVGRNLALGWIENTILEQAYVSTSEVWMAGFLLLMVGSLVGAGGSALALRRFLDV